MDDESGESMEPMEEMEYSIENHLAFVLTAVTYTHV